MIKGVHELIIPSTVLIEVAIVMSRAVGEETAKTNYEKPFFQKDQPLMQTARVKALY